MQVWWKSHHVPLLVDNYHFEGSISKQIRPDMKFQRIVTRSALMFLTYLILNFSLVLVGRFASSLHVFSNLRRRLKINTFCVPYNFERSEGNNAMRNYSLPVATRNPTCCFDGPKPGKRSRARVKCVQNSEKKDQGKLRVEDFAALGDRVGASPRRVEILRKPG